MNAINNIFLLALSMSTDVIWLAGFGGWGKLHDHSIIWNMIGVFYRKPWSGGCQGDVWVVHDLSGDGRSVADPDEGWQGNTEADR